MPVTDDLLNVNEAAAYLTIKPWTLRHWISDRKIDFVKYGNGVVRLKRSVRDVRRRPRGGALSIGDRRLLPRAASRPLDHRWSVGIGGNAP